MGFVGVLSPLPRRKQNKKTQEKMEELRQIKLDETRRTLTALANSVKNALH